MSMAISIHFLPYGLHMPILFWIAAEGVTIAAGEIHSTLCGAES